MSRVRKRLSRLLRSPSVRNIGSSCQHIENMRNRRHALHLVEIIDRAGA